MRADCDILLVSMPFASDEMPSIQLATLSAQLGKLGFDVEGRHFYLRAADHLGRKLYGALADPGTFASMLYAPFLFPDHYQRQRDAYMHAWSNIARSLERADDVPTWRDLLDAIDTLNLQLLSEIDPERYRAVGFSTCYNQVLPSLWLAGELKRRNPHLPVIFGGAEVAGEMGASLLRVFDAVDIVVQGEGEIALPAVLQEIRKNKADFSLPGVLTRDTLDRPATPPRPVKLDGLPIPDFGSYFMELSHCSPATIGDLMFRKSLPVEGSRGCSWRRCTFCGLNRHFPAYRTKSPAHIAAEINRLADAHACLSFSFVDNVICPGDLDHVIQRLEAHGRDYEFFVEIRPDQLTWPLASAMQRLGTWKVQIGIESFSDKALARMRKGVTVLQNIEALLLCAEHGIEPVYNLMYGFPDESAEEYEEILSLLPWLLCVPPPKRFSTFELEYGSEIHRQPKRYNIAEISPAAEDQLVYPPELLQQLVLVRHQFEPAEPTAPIPPEFFTAIRTWKSKWDETGKPLLTYRDGATFLQLYDRRGSPNVEHICLNPLLRQVFLACRTARTAEEICSMVRGCGQSEVEELLRLMVDEKLVLERGGLFLSLAVPERTPDRSARPQSV